MKHKTAELQGALLDAAVAKAEGRPSEWLHGIVLGCGYSTHWDQAGPIIERERISVSNPNGDPGWIGTIAYPKKPKRNGTPQWGHHWECGPTPLIAAMRAYVAAKLGDEVDL
jgi:hypothetical protein